MTTNFVRAIRCVFFSALLLKVADIAAAHPQTIPRKTVESSSIASVGYGTNKVLEIEFRSGAIYRYREVPEGTFKEFLRAKSKGRYFAAQVRGRYSYERLRGERQ